MNDDKKRLIVDMDGVLADVNQQFVAFEEKETGIQLDLNKLGGLAEFVAFPNGRKHVNQKGFFRDAPLMENAITVLEQLNDKYDLFIVSAAMEFPNSLVEKHDWLAEHFPFIKWQQIVFCGSKTVVQGDIMIDDHYKNLDYFKGHTILFTQPHNDGHNNKGHTRVKGWDDVAKILL